MNGFLSSSVGKKVLMSVSGLFLIVFLLVHLFINLLTLVSADVFNAAAHFMGSNPAMKIMEIALAAGFVIHMSMGAFLTFKNQMARPVKYAVSTKSEATWASKNMFITGGVILLFLVLHLMNYFYKIKFTDLIESGQMTEYQLVVGLFNVSNWYYVATYVLWFILLGLHLSHAFQSAFQTIGLNNKTWENRLIVIGNIYALVISIGFSIIPIYFFISSII
jgi:succinate dehydrogenase / fumarate reductase cytochrome b subunit